MYLPSRRLDFSSTTIRKEGCFFFPVRASLMVNNASSSLEQQVNWVGITAVLNGWIVSFGLQELPNVSTGERTLKVSVSILH